MSSLPQPPPPPSRQEKRTGQSDPRKKPLAFVPREQHAQQHAHGRTHTPRDASLPCNPQAERVLIGSIFIDPAQMQVCAFVDAEAFSDHRYATIWQAMRDVHSDGAPTALEIVIERMRQFQQLATVGGQAFVSSLTNDISNSQSAPEFAAIVARIGKQRQLLRLAAEATASAYRADCDTDALMAYVTEEIERIRVSGSASANAGERTLFTLRELMAEELPPVRYAVPDILPEGLSLLAAKQKIGKSWFALNIAIAVAAGGYALGAKPVAPGEVLYLALEDTKRRIQSRARQVIGEESIPEGLTMATSWPRLDEGGIQKLEKWIEEHPAARLVIVDVLAKVRPPRAKYGDIYAEDYAVMSPLKRLADEHHLAVLVIHHTRKASAADVFDEIRDSAGISGACDAVMVLQRSRGEADAILHITGRDVDEAQLALSFDKTRGWWNLVGGADDVVRSRERQEILNLLQQRAEQKLEAIGPSAIAHLLDKNVSTTKVLLSRLFQAGEVTRNESGHYSVNPVNRVNHMNL